MSSARADSLAKLAGGAVLAASLAALFASLRSPRRPQRRRKPAGRPPAVPQLHAASGMLALSVLLDSSVEHYRGLFKNPGMFAPLITSAAAVVGRGAAATGRDTGRLRTSGSATAIAIGGFGTAFHFYNIAKRPGGFGWLNLFYAAPPGAPAALALSGLLGLAADRLEFSRDADRQSLLNIPPGPALAALSAAGMLGTSAEAALLHYRGAFQNPFMFVPVTLPPAAALLLGYAALSRGERAAELARIALIATAAVGVAGVAFHAYGVSRAMGGWRNWSQNLLDGPPLPAPPAFTAFSIVGLTALSLLETDRQ